MHEPTLGEVPAPDLPRARWNKRWLLGAFLLLAVAGLGIVYYYLGVTSDFDLQQALAEAEQADPGWRILELEAKRREISDQENSGLNLIAAQAKLPPRITPATATQTQEQEALRLLRQSAHELEAPVLLDKRQADALHKELQRNAGTLAEIAKIKRKSHGRYPITYTRDFIGTRLPHTQDTRNLANLLADEALVLADDRNLDGALMDCRCIIHAERAIGDEPTLISMLVRIAIHQMAVKQIERVLAQGEPSAASLADLQQLLEEEAAEPLFLIGARGERGGMDGLLEALQTGAVKTPWPYVQAMAAPGQSPSVLQGVRLKFAPASLKADRAALLSFNNRIVELAKLPVEEQWQRLEELHLDPKRLPYVARLLTQDWSKLLLKFHRDQAALRCGILLLAVERYRRDHHGWPSRLDDLVPAYLARVPLDPFDGQPVRLSRFDNGVALYSMVRDGQGNLSPDPAKPGTAWGYRLWDISKRRQPSRPPEQR
jgi:hypothetical protein